MLEARKHRPFSCGGPSGRKRVLFLVPYHGCASIEAPRFGLTVGQPLMAGPAGGANADLSGPGIDADDVLVTAFEPGDDGRSRILRLFGAGGKAAGVSVRWPAPQPALVWLGDLSEKPLWAASSPVEVPAWGIVTLRAENPCRTGRSGAGCGKQSRPPGSPTACGSGVSIDSSGWPVRFPPGVLRRPQPYSRPKASRARPRKTAPFRPRRSRVRRPGSDRHP